MKNKTQKLVFFNQLSPLGENSRRAFNGALLKTLLEKKLKVSFDSCVNSKGLIDFDALCDKAFTLGIQKEEFKELLDKSAKRIFADNFLWKFLKKTFDIDLQIPLLTGFYTTHAVKGNLILNVGHKHYADQAFGLTTTPIVGINYGTGSVAAAGTDTSLGAEVARGAATITSQTTTTTGDTGQAVKSFTAAGTQVITEEGLVTDNVSGGIQVARQVFAAVNMNVNDIIQFTHKIQS